MKKRRRGLYELVLLLGVGFCWPSFAQTKYWVYFTDKDTSGFDPFRYFDHKAIERRLARGGALFEYTDVPVHASYIRQVAEVVNKVGMESRWINALSVTATANQLEAVGHLPFVSRISPMQCYNAKPASLSMTDTLDQADQLILERQLGSMQGERFINRRINGRGLRIAIFDGGFSGVDKSPVFKHLFEHGQIINTHNFRKGNSFVYSYMTHGSMVLSCLAGMYQGKPMGLATGAEFLLAVTEIRPEKHVEEEYWLAAVEWADKNGADIISSSLGYTSKLYPLEALDGKTSIVARAAQLAFSKGILVVNAMGNEGSNKWEVMATPADADSVLSVGGINTSTGVHINFSSYGPTRDLRMKPNVCAPGVVIASKRNGVGKAYGTSFAAPLAAGFAACVWQLNRDKNNRDIFHIMQRSGHLFPYFDYAHGYGVPQASHFFEKSDTVMSSPFRLNLEGDSLKVEITELPTAVNNQYEYLYYHVEGSNGALRYYAVIRVKSTFPLRLCIKDIRPGEKARFWYKRVMIQFEGLAE